LVDLLPLLFDNLTIWGVTMAFSVLIEFDDLLFRNRPPRFSQGDVEDPVRRRLISPRFVVCVAIVGDRFPPVPKMHSFLSSSP